jgi:hypothetical protein
MYALRVSECADALAEPVPLAEDRRRSGRPRYISPALIPLLRNPVGVAIVDDATPAPRAIEVVRQRILSPWASFARWAWVSLGAWISTVTAIRLATGNVSWVALAGGIILLLWLGWASREEWEWDISNP